MLAPAGSWESLNAAIQAGADAVYFGVDKLNMRARASRSFQISDIEKIVETCRQNRVRSYLTLNTLIYDEDLPLLEKIGRAAENAGISAVIVSDMAAVEMARRHDLEIHISTQMNISNIQAVRFYAQFADVMVLARELTLAQIQGICAAVEKEDIRGPDGNPVRIELFIHGALCVAVAGKCSMSLALTNHSANRGDCFQMCRRTYRVTDTETDQELEIANRYVLSPGDLCTVGIMDRLIGSGASVFKIEGRGRAAEYVFHTTRVYRQAMDAVIAGTWKPEKIEAWKQELRTVFNRGFWENGYYLGESLGAWSGAYGSRATRQKTHVGKVLNYYRKSNIAHVGILNDEIRQGETIAITGPTTGYVEFIPESLFVNDRPANHARKDQEATFPCPEKVRPNDQVYVIRERTDWQS